MSERKKKYFCILRLNLPILMLKLLDWYRVWLVSNQIGIKSSLINVSCSWEVVCYIAQWLYLNWAMAGCFTVHSSHEESLYEAENHPMSETVLLPDEEEGFALEPVDATGQSCINFLLNIAKCWILKKLAYIIFFSSLIHYCWEYLPPRVHSQPSPIY